MIEIFAYFLFSFAGVLFGLFGSGGSIIIIPILIYLFQFPIYEATNYSLILVFIISFISSLKHFYKKNIIIKDIVYFLIPTVIFTLISRSLIFPLIPEDIEFLKVNKKTLLMFLFSLVVFFSGLSILIKRDLKVSKNSKMSMFLLGLLVGLLTGLLGIGGGFIIVPSLVIFSNFNMKRAAASGLFIIMINTMSALVLELTIFEFDFNISLILKSLSTLLLGTFVGIKLYDYLDVIFVKKLFSFTLLVLSLLIVIIELF
tara:strand:- start:1356 stop:2129 length:774 start_codon:yes stop_codon:yes gene_type:complete